MSKLYFLYGAMNCGKSTQLLQVAHNYEERGMSVLVVKPAIDTKAEDRISSRLGIERKVDLLWEKDIELIDSIDFNNYDLILVDEAQFLSREQIDELFYIAKLYNTPVMCYGLRSDFRRELFSGSERLFALADEFIELKTICRCGKKATFNLRKVDGKPVFDGNSIEIDNQSNIEYESVCGDCYIKYYNKKETI